MEKYIDRECSTHGLTGFVLEGSGYYRCKKCRMDAVKRYRKSLKVRAIEYKGGCCEVCGYDKCLSALEFHHKDPNGKDFGISSNGNTSSWKKIKEEIEKCYLLCANCHREEHERLRN